MYQEIYSDAQFSWFSIHWHYSEAQVNTIIQLSNNIKKALAVHICGAFGAFYMPEFVDLASRHATCALLSSELFMTHYQRNSRGYTVNSQVSGMVRCTKSKFIYKLKQPHMLKVDLVNMLFELKKLFQHRNWNL